MSPRSTKIDAVGPLSRLINVQRLAQQPAGRGPVIVEATAEECAALADDFGIDAIRCLKGTFAISGTLSRLVVTGHVEALVTQPCGVSLEPFEAPVREPVEVTFTDTDPFAGTDAEDAEVPDPIVGGRVDFGVLTAEFLALGIDPYPRKPGISFDADAVGVADRPFAALSQLRPKAD